MPVSLPTQRGKAEECPPCRIRRGHFDRLVLFLLALRIHFDALRLAPGPYLTACKWWLLRKRVRARGQFAPLLTKSSRAYKRWALQQAQIAVPSPPGAPVIIALVACPTGASGLEETLASLAAEGVHVLIVGDDPAADLARLADLPYWGCEAWLLPLFAGDRLAIGAARAYRAAMGEPGVTAIFADDDLSDLLGRRTAPHFKPDWNAELFRHHDYLTGACILRVGYDGLATAAEAGAGWAGALVDRAVAEGGGAVHLRQVLHHRRQRPQPCLPLPAVSIAPALPRITAIIPTRNRMDLLATCINGLAAADYPEIEVIVVDNDSDDPSTLAFLAALPGHSRPGLTIRVMRHPGTFNYSAINNRAVAEATGELLCLLNNDVEMLAPDWLAIMATQALRDEVGAVGAQLLYPDGRLQHAGVVIGVGNAAGHAHRFLKPDEEEGYFRRHALPQFVSAVTAACLVVQRERFLAVGGLDENSFAVAFNDVDLCLRLNGRGWQSFYEPRAVLVHHESVSRGFDRDPVGATRFASELATLQHRWRTDEVFDPYHHPYLSRASEQFALAI